MRINIDCVRVVMLTIENNLGIEEYMQLPDLMEYSLVQSFSKKDVEYSLHQLTKEKLIECEIERYMDGSFSYVIEDVTPSGHKLCDEFRNDTLWSKIKPHLEDVSSVAGLISSLASVVSAFVS